MKKRDPFRFRKSEIRSRDDGQYRHEFQQLPKAYTARQLAFSILDEFKLTKTFVSQLLEDHLEGQHRTFLAKPPLAAKVAAVTDRGGPSRAVRRAENTHAFTRLDRRLVTELVNGVVRRQSTLDAILEKYVSRSRIEIEGRLWTLLQLGTYQIALMTSVPVHAAVDETVELAKWLQQQRWCGFINGVLRSIAREINRELLDEPAEDRVPVEPIADRTHPEPALETTPAGDANDSLEDHEPPVSAALPEAAPRYRKLSRAVFPSPETSLARYVALAWGLPTWLVERWSLRFSKEELLRMAAWFEHRQSHSLRINPLKTTREELLAKFAAVPDLTPDQFGPGGRAESIRYDGQIRIIDLPGFGDGLFTVQDETAMAAATLLAPQPGEAVLDLCAAPGTKTTHLAELMQNQGRILAADVDGRRLRRVEENLQRLGLNIIEPLRIPESLTELPHQQFDAVLVDVPCSNTGVLGKRPEVRLRIKPADIEELSALQLRLLATAASLTKPGGRIVYSTCSIEPEENSAVLTAFLAANPGFQLVEQHEYIPGNPTDGGFQALLRKAAAGS